MSGFEQLFSPVWITDVFRSAIRGVSERRVGIEVERIAIWNDGSPFQYSTQNEKAGAEHLLNTLSKKFLWPIINNGHGKPIGLNSAYGKVSLEPGSQLELSTDPFISLMEVEDNLIKFEAEVEKIPELNGLLWVALGVNPLHSVSELELIPSPRYKIMDQYLGARAKLGTSMMRRTSSVQINLDYTSEEEGIEMLQASLLLSPFSYLFFANSPFVDKKLSGSLSYRSAIWRETDPDRTGLLPEVFKKGFNFEDYAKLLWNEPLMFVQNKKKQYVAANGTTLTDIANGKLNDVGVDDNNQMNAIRELFSEARLKPGYIEVRSIDGLQPHDRYAASAFWMGLLYNEEARKKIIQKMSVFTLVEVEKISKEISEKGWKTEISKFNLSEFAKELVIFADEGLKARGLGEEKYLFPLYEFLEKKTNPATLVIEKFNKECKGDWLNLLEATKQKL